MRTNPKSKAPKTAGSRDPCVTNIADPKKSSKPKQNIMKPIATIGFAFREPLLQRVPGVTERNYATVYAHQLYSASKPQGNFGLRPRRYRLIAPRRTSAVANVPSIRSFLLAFAGNHRIRPRDIELSNVETHSWPQ